MLYSLIDINDNFNVLFEPFIYKLLDGSVVHLYTQKNDSPIAKGVTGLAKGIP